MDGHDGQHVVLYKRLCCVSGPVRLTIIADKFKRTEMISSTLSDYSEIKLELYNRKKKKRLEIQKHLDTKQHLSKQYIGQKKKSQENF